MPVRERLHHTHNPKRASVVLALLVFTGLVFGQDNLGDPSNLVGVWKMTLQPGPHLISFPLLPTEATVESVLGDQLPGGTSWETSSRLVTVGQAAVRGSYYNDSSGEWIGTLHSLAREKGYWLIIPEGNDPVVLHLVGAAIEQDTSEVGTMRPGLNIVANPHPYPSSLEGSGLRASGMTSARYVVTSDRIHTWEAGNLATAWPTNEGGWEGSPLTFQPGKGYILIVAPGHPEFNWRWPSPQPDGPLPEPGGMYIPMQLEDITLPVPSFQQPPWDQSTDPGRFKVKKNSIKDEDDSGDPKNKPAGEK